MTAIFIILSIMLQAPVGVWILSRLQILDNPRHCEDIFGGEVFWRNVLSILCLWPLVIWVHALSRIGSKRDLKNKHVVVQKLAKQVELNIELANKCAQLEVDVKHLNKKLLTTGIHR